jgi:hypothetical protein
MNRLFVVLLVGLLGIMLLSCKAGVHLSQREAKKIIEAHFKNPIIVVKRVDVREKGVEMLQFLKNERYIVSLPITTCCGNYYPTTAKGKPYFGETVKNLSGVNLFFDCGCYKKVIKSVKKIVIDEQAKSATVEYVEGLEPNEPIFSVVTKKYRGVGRGMDFNETQTIKVTLRQSPEGWKVEESPMGPGALPPSPGALETSSGK